MSRLILTAFALSLATLARAAPFDASDISNIVSRATASRTARLAEGRAIAEYERHMKSLEEHRRMTGGGEQSETEDMERAVPRLRGLADIERAARAETPETRANAAFVDTFSCLLALEGDEAVRFVAHLAKEGDDLGVSDPPLFAKVSSAAFLATRSQRLARAGCGYTGGVFTYSSPRRLARLRRQIESRPPLARP